MKTIYSILLIVIVAALTFQGVALIGTQAIVKNNLDEESLNLIGVYDSQIGNLTSVYEAQLEQDPDFEPDSNFLDEFIKEFSEHKTRIQQFKDGINLFYKIPDVLLLSIPFVEFSDLQIYRNAIWIMIGIFITIAIVLGLRNGKITEDQ